MSKSWSEVQAWAYLANRWEAAKRMIDIDRYCALICCDTLYISSAQTYGICESIMVLNDGSLINEKVRHSMEQRMIENTPFHVVERGSYWWPTCTKTGAKKRADFCYKMARLAEK